MNAESKRAAQHKRAWPWFLLAAFLLGIVLTFLWLSKEIQRVKRIKASTAGQSRLEQREELFPQPGIGFRRAPRVERA